MPRSVFKLLWDTLEAKEEIFAYVLNMDANGDGYWVLAHVTPSFSPAGEIVGYHSNRRKPTNTAVSKARDLYAKLREIEQAPDNRKDGMLSAFDFLANTLKTQGIGYDEFVLSL
jgi:hypothetical protein